MRVSLIAAVAENGVIGRDGGLPWHLSDDLRRFKQLTMGHTIVMGRRTWESIGRPLPGRKTVVVTRQTAYLVDQPSVEVVPGLPAATAFAASAGDDEVFVIGGAELYREAVGAADRMYITRVHATVDGDTYFPDINWADWRLVDSEEHGANEENDFACSFQVFERR
jgi:dihydrofolate reductase